MKLAFPMSVCHTMTNRYNPLWGPKGLYLMTELMRIRRMSGGAIQRTMKFTAGNRRVATVPSLVT